MSSTDLFIKMMDRYERQARLYPALLAGAPLLAIAIGIYGVPLEPKGGLIALLASFGIVYLLATISRDWENVWRMRFFPLGAASQRPRY